MSIFSFLFFTKSITASHFLSSNRLAKFNFWRFCFILTLTRFVFLSDVFLLTSNLMIYCRALLQNLLRNSINIIKHIFLGKKAPVPLGRFCRFAGGATLRRQTAVSLMYMRTPNLQLSKKMQISQRKKLSVISTIVTSSAIYIIVFSFTY